LQPIPRHPLEDALQEALDRRAPGWAVDGGGTLMSKAGEPLSCDIEVEGAAAPRGDVLAVTVAVMNAHGAPRGSYAIFDGGDPVPLGMNDGLGLYLNGTDLPAEVYETSSADELIDLLTQRLGDDGRIVSYWQGPTETALYLYGPSGDVMRERISDVLAVYPLARDSRLVTIT
jgi:hypothetical protein